MHRTKIYRTRQVQLPPPAARAYKQVLKDWATGDHSTQWELEKRLWLQRIAGGTFPECPHDAKFNELHHLLTGELAGEPVVVFFRFTSELNRAEELLKEWGLRFRRLDGSTPEEQRGALIKEFQSGEFTVFLLQTRCVQFGTNLSTSSTVIYYSNWDNPEIRIQSEDRILHAGKDDDLLYLDLVAEGTIDEAIVKALNEKKMSGKVFEMAIVSAIRQASKDALCGR